MKLMFHILRKNKKLGINNETLSWKDINEKLAEEFSEVADEINNYRVNKDFKSIIRIVEETFDLIQVCILILWRCHRLAKKNNNPNLIRELNIQHKDKLITTRRWEIETGIKVDVKE